MCHIFILMINNLFWQYYRLFVSVVLIYMPHFSLPGTMRPLADVAHSTCHLTPLRRVCTVGSHP